MLSHLFLQDGKTMLTCCGECKWSQHRAHYKVFYHYYRHSRLQFHELLCSLKCLNKIQKCIQEYSSVYWVHRQNLILQASRWWPDLPGLEIIGSITWQSIPFIDPVRVIEELLTFSLHFCAHLNLMSWSRGHRPGSRPGHKSARCLLSHQTSYNLGILRHAWWH